MDVDYTGVGSLLSNRARSAMLGALFDGDAVAATDLARRAAVAPSTASEHLRALVDGGLVSVVTDGRRRYYRIASAEIAGALESLGRICPRLPVRSLRASEESAGLGFARTCYDHLAGRVGVAVLDALLGARWLTPSGDLFELGPAGDGFARLGVDVAFVGGRRRAFARACVDATEHRPHLAGALGAAVCSVMIDRGWLVRRPRGRGLKVSERGVAELPTVLEIDRSILSPPAANAPRRQPDYGWSPR